MAYFLHDSVNHVLGEAFMKVYMKTFGRASSCRPQTATAVLTKDGRCGTSVLCTIDYSSVG
ncbi:MAG: hypothetical protein ABA06_00690 [Parcubacteria bacterium C7867-001]|nr:MAG: hypothetical protein ABA06_00690 [Parcubacteria bacterium C7867-001]